MVPVSLICHTPIVIRGQHVNWSSFSQCNVRINRRWCVRLVISGRVLAQWWCLVAFMKATNLLHRVGDAHSIVRSHRDGHQNGQQSGYILHYCCVDCSPGGRRGDTERVVTQWWRSVASGEALVMLHREMSSVLHQRTAMAIEMAHDGGTFVRRHRLSTAVIVAKDHVIFH